MLYFFLTRDLLEIHCIVRRAVKRMRERCLNTGLNMFVLLTAGTLSLLSHAAVLRMCDAHSKDRRAQSTCTRNKTNILSLCEFCGACAIKAVSRKAVEFLRGRKQRRKNRRHNCFATDDIGTMEGTFVSGCVVLY